MSEPARVLSYSGGKDSTALYLLALEHGRPFRAVFADTGNEHPITLDYVRDLPGKTGGPAIQWVKADLTEKFARKRAFIAAKWPRDGVPAARVDRALELLTPTGIPFLDLCMLKGRFPSVKSRFCTDELKIVPMFDHVTAPLARAGATIISWQGVRAEESEARSHLPLRQRINLAPYSARKAERDEADAWRAYAFRPLIAWKVGDVFAFHKRHGLAPNPLYSQGMTRVGCMPCIMAETALIGQTPNGSSATTEKRGAPNPEFASWLMGWPDELMRGVWLGIQSFRSSRQKSSGPSSKRKG